jgi:hypothetical protein
MMILTKSFAMMIADFGCKITEKIYNIQILSPKNVPLPRFFTFRRPKHRGRFFLFDLQIRADGGQTKRTVPGV